MKLEPLEVQPLMTESRNINRIGGSGGGAFMESNSPYNGGISAPPNFSFTFNDNNFFDRILRIEIMSRKQLFNMMNEIPTIYEVVTGTTKKQIKERSTVTNNSSRKNNSRWKVSSESQPKISKLPLSKDEEDILDEEEEDEHGETLCGARGGFYSSTTVEFWIACDMCENSFHGKCVKITPARAEHIKQ